MTKGTLPINEVGESLVAWVTLSLLSFNRGTLPETRPNHHRWVDIILA